MDVESDLSKEDFGEKKRQGKKKITSQ